MFSFPKFFNLSLLFIYFPFPIGGFAKNTDLLVLIFGVHVFFFFFNSTSNEIVKSINRYFK